MRDAPVQSSCGGENGAYGVHRSASVSCFRTLRARLWERRPLAAGLLQRQRQHRGEARRRPQRRLVTAREQSRAGPRRHRLHPRRHRLHPGRRRLRQRRRRGVKAAQRRHRPHRRRWGPARPFLQPRRPAAAPRHHPRLAVSSPPPQRSRPPLRSAAVEHHTIHTEAAVRPAG